MLRSDVGGGFATRAIHAGQEPDPTTGAVIVPIYQTSTFATDEVGTSKAGYDYSRAGNPTRTALETALASLEGAQFGFAFASGMAAEDTLLRAALRPGDHIILPTDAYGGTYRLVNTILGPWGVEHTALPLSDLDAVRAAMQPNTKMIMAETPTNPLLNVFDIPGLADVAHAAGATLTVDNTFATPYLQNPLALGADVVVHSTTKYIGGHSDVIGGALLLNDGEMAAKIQLHSKSMGSGSSPFDSWLTLRGLKTLAVRMEKHCDNAEQVAAVLVDHPKVSAVLYPGLPGHPGHALAAQQMRRFGGMVSFRMSGGREEAVKACSRTRVFLLAESLGGVESLIEHPGLMTHTSVAGSKLEVPDDLIRLSVGIEDIQDLLADLTEALS
ncbi:MAG: cystathionine gamma-synthase [Nakamurella sp.]